MSHQERGTAYIALGSNLGDRRETIESALRALAGTERVEVARVSTIIETAPEGPAPQGWYLNAAAELRPTCSPRELLDVMLEIERRHGRDRAREVRFGPRTLDLDLLLYDQRIVNEPGLTLPHPRLHERVFVLEPLAEIAPRAFHPVLRMTMADIVEAARASGRLMSADRNFSA
jgi:2-amino-4-hydroxy-6-hydroxymethyldihydropteridine diphosphokinase